MRMLRIEYKIVGYDGKVHEGLLHYPKYQKVPGKMVAEETMIGYIKITINNKVVTRGKDINFEKIKNTERRHNLIRGQRELYQRGMQDYIDDYIYRVILTLLEDFILLLQRNKREIRAEFWDNPHYLEFKLDNSTLIISFICDCDLGGCSEERGLFCHETTLGEQVSFKIAVDEIIRSTRESFLDQLVEINPRLKEWEGYQEFEKKIIEIETLRDKYFYLSG